MRVIIFGTGDYYQRFKQVIAQNNDVIALLDNKKALKGTTIDDIVVHSPEQIQELSYDIVVLCSIYCKEMRDQLLSYDVDESKILYIEDYAKLLTTKTVYDPRKQCNSGDVKKKILVVSCYLANNGGSLAVVHAVQILLEMGYMVELSIPGGDEPLIQQVVGMGVLVTVRPYLPNINEEMKEEVSVYDIVLVNVYQMLPSAVELSKIKPVLWWIHESGPNYCPIYPNYVEKYSQYHLSEMNVINVVGVCKLANHAFNMYYPHVANRCMEFGIPDTYDVSEMENPKERQRVTFAIIGGICRLKAQKVFLEAVSQLSEDDRNKAAFYIIGKQEERDYAEELSKINEERKAVDIIYGLPHDQMMQFYRKIDVVVCCSMEDNLNTTVIEGMMNRKVTIATNTTGVSMYMKDGINGIIIEPGNSGQLRDCMHKLITDNEYRLSLAENARRLYEKQFTLEAFKNRLQAEIDYTLNHWHASEQN